MNVFDNQFGRLIDKIKNNDNIKVARVADETAVYVMIVNLEEEFLGGQYLAKIVWGRDFAFSHPYYQFMTPNGVMECNCRTRLENSSIGPNLYVPVISSMGSLLQWHELRGIGIIGSNDRSVESIRGFAAKSHEYNVANYPEILAMFK